MYLISSATCHEEQAEDRFMTRTGRLFVTNDGNQYSSSSVQPSPEERMETCVPA